MTVNPHIFREFSVRGMADRDLTDDVATLMGQAVGDYFRRRGGQRLVVGHDVRHSSPRISRSLIAGLLEAGLHVLDVGLVPTPVHNFATDWYAADGGVMVTASHNPPENNGLKIRAAQSLSGVELQEIYRTASGGPSQSSAASAPMPGSAQPADPIPTYLARIRAHARLGSPLKVVVDGGHGTNGSLVSHLLRDLGCQVTELYSDPDGDFPGRGPDPTAPGALSALSVQVQAEGANLGVAYDGDGDRLAVVDERGQPVLGDQVLMLLARDVLRRAPAKIVYEVLCTQALADDVLAHGGQPVMVPSGYAFVHQAMCETGAALGGEFSGHLFFNEPDFHFDDAILATVKLLTILSGERRPLSALVSELPAYYSTPQIRLPCPDDVKGHIVEQVKHHFQAMYPVSELDGARIDFGDGWALVRASNTQPALSLRFEATSPERLEQLKEQVLEHIERLRCAS